MKNVKSFIEFLNEDAGSAKLAAAARSMLGDLLSGKQFATGGFEIKPSNSPVTIGSQSTSSDQSSTATSTETSAETSAETSPEPLAAVPGNDDFMLYMQHQQGQAGAKGLIRAMLGQGDTIHPDTLKVKKGIRYANLIMNVPSDRPQYKADIIKALNAGDQKTGATLFLKMWKEKWNSKGSDAKTQINLPKNKEVKGLIQKYSSQMSVPYDFAVTVAYIESGFNPKSGNNRYKGVYALSKEEFDKYVPGGDIYNANDNVKAGIMCLKNNIKEFTKSLGPILSSIDVGTWAKTLA